MDGSMYVWFCLLRGRKPHVMRKWPDVNVFLAKLKKDKPVIYW